MIVGNSLFLIGILFSFLFFILLFTVYSVNPVNTVLLLILSFILAFIILLLLGLEFLAVIFVIIYAGAISVLFLFVIMMINLKTYFAVEESYYSSFFFFAIATICIVFLPLKEKFFRSFYSFNWVGVLYFRDELGCLGYGIYNFFFFQLFLLVYILLAAMIGAVALVFTVNIDSRSQNMYLQVKKNVESTLFLLN